MTEHRYPRGRIRPKWVPALRYAHDYLTSSLPPPVYPLSAWPVSLAPGMFGNNKWGNCVQAAEWEGERALAAIANSTTPPPTPGDPTPAVARYKRFTGATTPPGTGTTIAHYCGQLFTAGLIKGYAPVTHRNIAQRDAFLQAGYGLLTGVCLTATAETLFDEGKVWGSQGVVTPDLTDGHGMWLCGSTGPGASDEDTDLTWAGFAHTTDQWRKSCTEELWLIAFTEEQMAPFDAALLADIRGLHGVGS